MGLCISSGRGTTSTGVEESDRFSEPAIYLVRPDVLRRVQPRFPITGSFQALRTGRELVERGAPAFLESHLFVLAAVGGISVQHAGRIPGALSLRLERNDRGQRQPGFRRPPTLGERRGEHEALFRNYVQKTAFDMRLEFATALAHLRLEAATRAQVQFDDLAFDGIGYPPFRKMLGPAPCLPDCSRGGIDEA